MLESDYPNVGVQLNAVQGECVVHCAISTGIDAESGSRVVKLDNRVNRDPTGPRLFEELDDERRDQQGQRQAIWTGCGWLSAA